jgi:Glycosyl transferases group 1
VPDPGLIVDSKSQWDPPIRREHALARLARRAGHPVTFVERPVDIRALRRPRSRRDWFERLSGKVVAADADLRTIARSTPLPPHVHRLAEWCDGQLFRRVIPDADAHTRSTIVTSAPWHWPAVSRMRSHRRVLDAADDWSALIPARERRVRELYARAAAEADEIVVVSEQLAELFDGREVTVVRNAVDERLLSTRPAPPPGGTRLVYVGTLSERFDAPLAGALLDRLTGWTLDLYGPCAYAKHGEGPDDELARLLTRTDARARWHGPVPRDSLGHVLDGADVLLLPNRPSRGRGQDSMKIYDYAARGRPIVATVAATEGITEPPPDLRTGAGPDELAQLVLGAPAENPAIAAQRRRWAEEQTWESRWPTWRRALFGEQPFNPDHDPEPGVANTCDLVEVRT